MDFDLLGALNSFSCHARRQAEIKALFVACFYLHCPPSRVKLIRLSSVYLGKDSINFHWNESRAGVTISSIDRSVPGGQELYDYVEARLKSSNGRNFYLFSKASKNKNWFGWCCRSDLNLKVSFFRKCVKVRPVFLPNKKYFR
jgi:hypothetical protein